MAVRLNEDKEMVQTIRDGLKRTGGYCPAVWSGARITSASARNSVSRLPIPTSRVTAIVCCITRIENFLKKSKKAVDKFRSVC